MNYKTISYQRIKNLGNYETKRLEMSVELEPEDDPEIATKELMAKVDNLLYPPPKEGLDLLDSF